MVLKLLHSEEEKEVSYSSVAHHDTQLILCPLSPSLCFYFKTQLLEF